MGVSSWQKTSDNLKSWGLRREGTRPLLPPFSPRFISSLLWFLQDDIGFSSSCEGSTMLSRAFPVIFTSVCLQTHFLSRVKLNTRLSGLSIIRHLSSSLSVPQPLSLTLPPPQWNTTLLFEALLLSIPSSLHLLKPDIKSILVFSWFFPTDAVSHVFCPPLTRPASSRFTMTTNGRFRIWDYNSSSWYPFPHRRNSHSEMFDLL